ncbi:MAG: alpha/beta fold hydrolase [Chloroflexi bacterium CFX7]|nr:alpha/beta fold hydrolase [Chloroflexi bacterium CFX7]
MREVSDHFLWTADGLRLHVADFGGNEGPPLLFIHGSFGHARVWDFVVSHLPRQRRAVAMDLPGHGESSHAPSEERYAFERLVEDIRAVVEFLGETPVLAGHSVGSGLAMLCGASFPGLLAGAVLMDIDPRPPDRQPQHLNDVGQAPPRSYASVALAAAREARIAPAASPAVHSHLALHGYQLTDAGYTVVPSQANFILVHLKRDAGTFRDACAKHDVLVGRVFPPLTTHTRISIGTMDEMQRAVQVFKQVLG